MSAHDKTETVTTPFDYFAWIVNWLWGAFLWCCLFGTSDVTISFTRIDKTTQIIHFDGGW